MKLFSLPAAEDRTASGPKIWCKARTTDWITQCEGTQNRSDRPALMSETKVKGFHSRNVFEPASGIYYPAFDTDTEVTMEKIFEVNATAPGMIRFDVAIIPPFIACKDVSAPSSNVKF